MNTKTNLRLATVDGWRAVSVLGVIWWHAWMHTGNAGLFLALGSFSLNLQRLLVPLGNGVHFFFVISGFCIQLSLARHTNPLTSSSYAWFIFNRWKRLSPAFYATCAVTAVALLITGAQVRWTDLLAHATWTYALWPGVDQLAASFWSLNVEWEFYLLAPLFMLVRQNLLRWILIGLLTLASLAATYALNMKYDGVIPQNSVRHIYLHFPAFVFGMLVAEVWMSRACWINRMHKWIPLAAGAMIAFIGRGLFATEVFNSIGKAGVLAKTIGPVIMVAGFSLMLASTLGTRSSAAGAILESRPLQIIGKLSYGIYLWHWWPCEWLGHFFRDVIGTTPLAHYITVFATITVSLPLAWLTYIVCERPYFGVDLGIKKTLPAQQSA